MRLRPQTLPAPLAYTLLLAMGCAGAGSMTGAGGSSSSGTAGTSSAGSAGTTGNAGATGSGGTVGSAGTTGSGGTPGAGGSVSPGAAGSSTPGTGGVAGTTTGAGGTGATAGTSASGSAGTTGAGGITSGAAGTSSTGAGGTGGICQMAQYVFEPKIPTVYMLVDRSGSMFDCLTTPTTMEPMCGANGGSPMDTTWYKVKEASRAVLTSLEHDVRFGFATIWGQNPMPASTGGLCPPLQGMVPQKVAPKEDNAAAIMAMFDALPFQPNTTEQGRKFETPASETIQIITAEMRTITAPGDKYILFITDGQPDYCDDSNSLCAPDSVVGYIQAAYTAGIRTIVMGLQTTVNNAFPPGALKAWANAGAGEPTVAPLNASAMDTFAIYDQCQGVAPWRADLTALGKPDMRGSTVGTYAATAGPTPPYMPSVTDQTQLVNQLSTALAGVKSCTFDLTDVGGKAIKVDVTKLAQARVLIEGTAVPLDPTNGWNVDIAAPTQLVLSGMACTRWRMPNNKKIDFEFPCGTIIFE